MNAYCHRWHKNTWLVKHLMSTENCSSISIHPTKPLEYTYTLLCTTDLKYIPNLQQQKKVIFVEKLKEMVEDGVW